MRYQLYELYGFHDGNDDILSDIGNVGANERHGMWALKPYDVSDGPGVINEDIPPVEFDALDDKSYAIELAQAVAEKLNLGNISYLGYGGNGVAFEVNNKVVLKLTIDLGEADAAFIVLRNGAKYLAEIYNIYKVVDTETNRAVFAILEENIINKPTDKFLKMETDINKISPEFGFQDLLVSMKRRDRFDYNAVIKYAKEILTANPEANVSQADRKAASEHLIGLANIRQELIDLGIKSTDYIAHANLGYSDGVLKYFDVGGHMEPEPSVGKNIITLPENVEEPLEEDYPRDRADAVAAQVGKKLGVEPHYLDKGSFGVAYDIGDDKILKITKDNSEAAENLRLIGKPLKYIAQPYNVYKVESTSNPDFPKTYAIILEKLKTDASYFKRMYDRLEYAFRTLFDINYKDALEAYLYGHQFDHDINKDEVDRYFKKNSEDAEFFFSILRIAEELDKYGVESVIEYYNPYNLGYKKSGVIGLFDVGFGNGWLQPDNPEKINVNVDEDGSSKFSTDSEFGQDGFPPYNNGDDNSPMVKNDLDANTAMYGDDNMDEDLKYNHVKGDATDDEYMLTEVIEGGEYQAYHGSDTKIEKFVDDFVGTEEATDQEGPGIYFSTNLEDARAYGNYIHSVILRPRKLVDESSHEDVNEDEIIQLVRSAPDWEMNAQNWAEDPEAGLREAIDSFMRYSENEKDLFQQIWYDFFRYHPIEYIRGMVKLGYDGQIIEKAEGNKHFIVYNPEIIEVTGSDTLDEDRKKAWVPGSKAVTVKKNCRLGGKADGTSDACNQGDINNLEFTALTEDETGMGVGDKYAQKFGVKSDFDTFEKDFNAKQNEGSIIYKDEKGWGIVKNPKTLTNIGDSVRGVITVDGDLYLELYSDKIHKNIVDVLNDKGIVSKSFLDALDDYIPTEYLTVQRDGGTNDIVVGESNDAMQDDEQMFSNWREPLKVPSKEEVLPYFQKFMDAAKRKHPRINFINEHIAVYRRAKYINKGMLKEVKPFGMLKEVVAKTQDEVDRFISGSKVKETVYHGSPVGGIEDFKEPKGGGDDGQAVVSSGLREDAIYFTSNPRLADVYRNKKLKPEFKQEIERQIKVLNDKQMLVRNNRDYDALGNEIERLENKLFGQVYGVKLNIKNPLTFDGKGMSNSLAGNPWNELEIDLGYKVARGKEAVNLIAKKHDVAKNYWKYDGIIGKNIIDMDVYTNRPDDSNSEYLGNVYAVFSPNQILILDPVLMDDSYGNFNAGGSLRKVAVNENDIMQLNDLPFKSDIENLGGKIYSVGGAVRDEFLGKESKDLDILITGIPMDRLEKLLSKYGRVDAVGKSFGVLKFKPQGASEEIDVAIPRTEFANDDGGHKGFDVTANHELPLEKDLERRDFTINAIAKDIDGNVIDPFGGQKDLQNKTIRVVNPEAFSDDPLRMLRGVQFASRFGFNIEPETMQMIKANAQRIKEIPAERILTEFDKILTKGDNQKGVDLLVETGLFKNIFGFGFKPAMLGGYNFNQAKTMGELIFLMGRSLKSPAEFFKANLKGDNNTYKEIRALEEGNKAIIGMDVVKARTIAHNVYSLWKPALGSELLPDVIKNAAQELLSGKYPKGFKDMAVNGNDLKSLGYKQGEELGNMLKQMLVKIYADEIRNDREELLPLAQQGLGNLKEGWDDYENPVWEVNGEMVDVEFFVKEYDIWNTQGGTPGYPDPSRESVLEFLQNNYEDFSKDERLKKELYWTLTDRELLKEEPMKKVSYSAVVLDDESRATLIKVFSPMIPDGWKIYSHHMTIKMGPLEDGSKEQKDMIAGEMILLDVVDYAIDDKVMAVGVKGYDSRNEKPHITIAVNTAEGGKPFLSNKLTDWRPINFPIELTGKVSEEE